MTVRLLAVAMSPMIASRLAATRAAKMIAVDTVTIRVSFRRMRKNPIGMGARVKAFFASSLGRLVPVAVNQAATKSATVAAAPVRFQKPALRARDLSPPGRHRVYLSPGVPVTGCTCDHCAVARLARQHSLATPLRTI